jgi:trehalose 6-phosphate phosphatase
VRHPKGAEQHFYEPEDVEYIALVRKELAQALSGVPEVFLEHKGPIMAVHYRGLDSGQVAEVERTFLQVIERHHQRVMISHGDHVLEARTRSPMNKARAVDLIRRELPAGSLTLYFGDDLTDRDVFRELKGSGISVEVGGGDSGLADFTLPTPEAVTEILGRLLGELKSTEAPSTPKRKKREPEK